MTRRAFNGFLPPDRVWVGFDADGKAIAASIESRQPSMKSVFVGCCVIAMCKTRKPLFGEHISAFEFLTVHE